MVRLSVEKWLEVGAVINVWKAVGGIDSDDTKGIDDIESPESAKIRCY